MPHRTLTNFQIAVIIAAMLAALAMTWGDLTMLGMVAFVFVIVVGLGVAIPQFSFFGPYVCRGNTSRRCVALTFDDGPDASSTPVLLELLRNAKVEATFFCIGKRVEANAELVARILREGHLLENHSYAHSNTTNFFSVKRLRNDLAQAQTAIEQATGIAPKCFRPPMGLSNPRVFRVARALGLTVVGWSARGFDTRVTNPERIVAQITRSLGPGAIILLHDGNIPPERLVATVKLLLDRLHKLGYEVVRLDRLLT